MIEMSGINFSVVSVELSLNEHTCNKLAIGFHPRLKSQNPLFELLLLNQKDLEPLTLYTTIK